MCIREIGMRKLWIAVLLAGTICVFGVRVGGGNSHADMNKYEATLESLNSHPLPSWYADAKLGIFIHWGLYSVPGWAVLTPEGEKLSEEEYVRRNPYAEWYLNTVRLKGSPTEEYHKEHYGANFDYYNFAETFNREIRKWNPQEMAAAFKMAGAKYVVLTSKHHEGFTLWPSDTPNAHWP